MFRVSQFMREILHPTPPGPRRDLPGPVVIWNLIRRCNLKCRHCYSISGDVDFVGELSTAEIHTVMDDLKQFSVPVLILSGGEPLLRPDIFDIARRAKSLGFYLGLSSNGTLIDAGNIAAVAKAGFDYLGISLDGIGRTHDIFRGRDGAFDASLAALRLCREHNIKTGVRFTLNHSNTDELRDLLDLTRDEGIEKFYLSHLNYAGRGNKNRGDDAIHAATRASMDLLFDAAWRDAQEGSEREYVTGNNDADGVYLLFWAQRHVPQSVPHLRAKLAQWGGNASGVNVANIDNLGNVHPDTFWWHHTLGNVRERPFSAIWSDLSDPLLAGLRARPRQIAGRCGACRYFDVCGGNTRIRAYQITQDPWAEDPGCYLTGEEIGTTTGPRITLTPYRGRTKATAHV